MPKKLTTTHPSQLDMIKEKCHNHASAAKLVTQKKEKKKHLPPGTNQFCELLLKILEVKVLTKSHVLFLIVTYQIAELLLVL